LAIALANRQELAVHLFHDERSAGFAALGCSFATGVPAVLLCTSGTAATHFHAAVTEASASNVAMIVCTADRPAELHDVSAPQTIDQTNLFGNAARWFHDPGVPSMDASHTWRPLAARAYAASMQQRPGPVHLNLPFREPLVGTADELPAARDGVWSRTVRPVSTQVEGLGDVLQLINGRRGVVIAGNGSTRDVLSLAEALQWPIFADSTSGVRECHSHVLTGFDPVLRSESFRNSHLPEVVIRIGATPASKVLAQWVASSGCDVIQVSQHEAVIDPDHVVGITVVGEMSPILQSLTRNAKSCDAQWFTDWSHAESVAQEAIDTFTNREWCEPTAARETTKSMQVGSHLVVSSSMPIRDVEWFGTVTPGVAVHSNRGTNGIDGVMSTAIGVALASQASVTVYIGDVAFLHDSTALIGLLRRGIRLRIVVVNNDGGSIFSFLPQAEHVSESTFELLYGTPHGVNISDIAAAHGITYVLAANHSELRHALESSETQIIEVKTTRSINVDTHSALNDAVVKAIG
jgi:2-succinyl-5-enolpyruvyl-6-hydroxy-3-cyclohexene-1-carboxylate synthase